VGSALYRVPATYYDWPLARRAQELACTPDRLCKTIVMENAGAAAGAVGDPSLPLGQQRFIAVVLQYVTRLDTAALERALRAHGAVGEPRLRQAPDAVALTGFGFGAITPVGSVTPLPVVVAKPIACLPPPSYVWLGGGEVDIKLRMFTAQLLRPGGCSPGFTAVVLDCVEARDGEDGEGDAG
jgi:prolyl-tRNA editing enzyme YbaK/EbsC (Cys-tRNA(Pro) deacylase)